MGRKACDCFRVSAFQQSATVEPETDDRLAAAETEMAFAESAFNLAAANLNKYNLANQQMPIVFRTGDVTRIQTLVNNFERAQLERAVRSTLDRRNRALSVRADLLKALGRIR